MLLMAASNWLLVLASAPSVWSITLSGKVRTARNAPNPKSQLTTRSVVRSMWPTAK